MTGYMVSKERMDIIRILQNLWRAVATGKPIVSNIRSQIFKPTFFDVPFSSITYINRHNQLPKKFFL